MDMDLGGKKRLRVRGRVRGERGGGESRGSGPATVLQGPWILGTRIFEVLRQPLQDATCATGKVRIMSYEL